MRAMLIAVLFLVVVPAISAGAEKPASPGDYVLGHSMSTVQGLSTEGAGRGGAFAAIPDIWSANPAHCVIVDGEAVVGQVIGYNFDNFKADLVSLKYARRINNRSAFMLNTARLSGRADLVVPSPYGPLPARFSLHEEDLSVSYGQYLNEDWAFGIAVAPTMNVRSSVAVMGSTAQRIRSNPKIGLRLGAQGNLGDGWTFGAVIDRYAEDSTLDLYPGTPMASSVTGEYNSKVMRLGLAKSKGRGMLAVDYVSLKLAGPGTDLDYSAWFMGVEYQVTNQLRLRSGLADGRATYGLSYRTGDWSTEVAMTSGLYGKLMPEAFGKSTTSHLTVMYGW